MFGEPLQALSLPLNLDAIFSEASLPWIPEAMTPRLNLVVLRASDPDRLASFYSELGLSFTKHRHGTGPEHFACESQGSVFEIYPASSKNGPTVGIRLGFEVDDVIATVSRLVAIEAKLVSPPSDSPWGLRAVLKDFAGNDLEIIGTLPANHPG